MTWKTKTLVVSGVIAAAALLIAPQAAEADQCWAVSAAEANRAVAILNTHHDALSFCAPCREKSARPISVVRAEHIKHGEHHVVAATDPAGKVSELDLAYTYVRLKPDSKEFVNMASLVGCPVTDVPERIDASGATIK